MVTSPEFRSSTVGNFGWPPSTLWRLRNIEQYLCLPTLPLINGQRSWDTQIHFIVRKYKSRCMYRKQCTKLKYSVLTWPNCPCRRSFISPDSTSLLYHIRLSPFIQYRLYSRETKTNRHCRHRFWWWILMSISTVWGNLLDLNQFPHVDCSLWVRCRTSHNRKWVETWSSNVYIFAD